MIGDRFVASRVEGAYGVPITRNYIHTAVSTFLQGAVLINNAGEVEEGGTNPTDIVGVAAAPAGKAPGFEAANNPVVSTGRQRIVPVWLANANNIFSSKLVNGSAVTIAPTIADLHAEYGITAFSNIWRVDKSKTTTNARIVIVAIDTLNDVVFFKFLAAHSIQSG